MRTLFVIMSLMLAATAFASETGPVIVVPGRPDVPVIQDGRDISYAVVEGDWGLAHPGDLAPRVIYRDPYARPVSLPPPLHYYPSLGSEPHLGRREAPMDRRIRPAQSYHRSFSAQSDPTPATAPSPYDAMPLVVAPQINQGPRRR